MVEIPQKRVVEEQPDDEDPITTDRKMVDTDDIEVNVLKKDESRFLTQTWSE